MAVLKGLNLLVSLLHLSDELFRVDDHFFSLEDIIKKFSDKLADVVGNVEKFVGVSYQ